MTWTLARPEDEPPEPGEQRGVAAQVLADINAATLATIPTFVLVILLVATNDHVLLRAVAARGDFVGLMIMLVSPLLPLIVVACVFLFILRWTGRQPLVWAIMTGGVLLLLAAPMSVALATAGVAVARADLQRGQAQNGPQVGLPRAYHANAAARRFTGETDGCDIKEPIEVY